VFLSDLRLIRKDGLDITNKLKAALLTGTGRKYDLWENSTRKGRGVAILIARDLNCQVLDAIEDIDENIVMLKIKLNGSLFIISSIYGPNSGSADFYENLDVFLTNLTGTETCDIILAGDWNTVVDNSPVKDNLDLLNMVTFPNQSNNARLLRLMDKWQLFDAFRIKKPYSKEFSYAPFGTSRNNRSRLDFFLISASLVPKLSDSYICLGRLCKLFDHASVVLDLGTRDTGSKTANKKNLPVKNFVLNRKCYQRVIALEACSAMVDCAPENSNHTTELKLAISTIGKKLSNVKVLQIKEASGDSENNVQIEQLLSEIKADLDALPDTDTL
jgi:exonuclease III